MIDFEPLYQFLASTAAQSWAKNLPEQINHALHPDRNHQIPIWQDLIGSLPVSRPEHCILNTDCVRIGDPSTLDNATKANLQEKLKTFIPWRKGPFDLFGIRIDTEWRSDWKWQRLAPHISPLKNRTVLDVGCGSGYFCWRMLGEQAKFVVGIDPLLLNVAQFYVIRELYGGNPPVYVLPLGIEQLPNNLSLFDTLFSMGVLYHRRSPIDHLLELKACLKPGGELILETLIVDGNIGETLLPEDRYAGMRNVWFIPSAPTIMSWLKRCGFNQIRLVDITQTSTDEQHSTEWMPFQSLANHLDSANPSLTCEGLPAPKRAIFLANN